MTATVEGAITDICWAPTHVAPAASVHGPVPNVGSTQNILVYLKHQAGVRNGNRTSIARFAHPSSSKSRPAAAPPSLSPFQGLYSVVSASHGAAQRHAGRQWQAGEWHRSSWVFAERGTPQLHCPSVRFRPCSSCWRRFGRRTCRRKRLLKSTVAAYKTIAMATRTHGRAFRRPFRTEPPL